MSPEQIRGLPLDGRADIYSFGAMAYELVTGRPPFIAGTSQDLLAKHITEKPIPPHTLKSESNKEFRELKTTREFSDLIIRMLAKKRTDRPRDFHEVLIAMRSLKLFLPPERAPKE